jgi:sRNA-binding regulator protein Hfq
MRKFLLLSLISVVVVASSALADTIHLKNGSVLKGKVTSFADDQFIVMLDTGSGRYLSKAMVYMGDVARIEFDAAAGSPADTSSAATQPVETTPRITDDNPRRETKTRNPDPSETPVRPQTEPRETGPPETQTAPPPAKEPEATPTEKPAVSESPENERPLRKPLLAVKTMTVDVAAKKDWTSSGLIVKRGDHLRITASGTITLDPANGRTCGPEGIPDLIDPKKLMPDQPTGALIAVIASDNDDFIFLGRSGEFTATRDGLLFLSVNEGHLPDNVGSFRTVVEVLAQRKQ